MKQNIAPPQTFQISDSSAGLKAWISIDSLINNRCCGGLRMLPDISDIEIKELAKIMTLKFGFLGIPNGGAKAGICCNKDASQQEKLRLLKAFAVKLRSLLGDCQYNPHQDMNTNKQEIEALHTMLGMRIPRRRVVTEKSGWYTALGVISCVKTGSECQGLDLSSSTAAIEGFGKVGSLVAQELQQLGVRVVAVSTIQGALYSSKGLDIPKLVKMLPEFGSEVINHYSDAQRINKEALLELSIDILSPCARGYSFRMDNVSRIKAKLICPAANTPATPEAEEVLFKQGTISVPDFVANSGGVLGPVMELAGINPSEVADFINTHFSRQVSEIIKQAKENKIPPRKIAEEIAISRFLLMKQASESKSLNNKLFGFAVGLYRKGLIPRVFPRMLSGKYFQKRIEGSF
ncbi:MAG: Glu/Leu/Phe/Val dehydrogenase dimerization domain-containing protein [Candidatus Omnitrophota bacterium]|jgi:glutamate dehydrogenase/leucine dehydrogenase